MMRVLAAIAAVLLGALPIATYAHEPMLRQFVDAYVAGDVAAMPIAPGATTRAGLVHDEYAALYAASRSRSLVLADVRWSQTRITADYRTAVDGYHERGSVTIYTTDGLITRIAHDVAAGSRGGPDAPAWLADAGQLADKGTTALALTAGYTEGNPLLADLSPAGMIALGVGVVALRKIVIADLPMAECLAGTRVISSIGWGAAAWNAALLAGAATPLGAVIGIAAAVTAAQQDYRPACVAGDIRFAEFPNRAFWSESQ